MTGMPGNVNPQYQGVPNPDYSHQVQAEQDAIERAQEAQRQANDIREAEERRQEEQRRIEQATRDQGNRHGWSGQNR